MNNIKVRSNFAGTATVVLLSFLLFYFPSMLAIFSKGDEPWRWTLMSIVMATLYTAIFCINYFWIVPATLFKNDRKLIFFLSNILLILLACSIIPIWFESHGGLPRPRHLAYQQLSIWQYLMGYIKFIIRDGITMILAAALAYALRLSKEHENMRRRELELDAERQQIELKSLKAQLNPHFLFNSLNNIYALITISPDRAQKALHDLSNMLRFMIYDAACAYVPLSKEVQFISDYVELMKLRLSSSIKLECNISTIHTEGLSIAPLLFLTLVENAFKHATNNGSGSFINIEICTDGECVTCRVRNSCAEDNVNSSKPLTESGVGLTNVERQLRLLYPQSHVISLDRSDNVFTAEIKIQLNALHPLNTI